MSCERLLHFVDILIDSTPALETGNEESFNCRCEKDQQEKLSSEICGRQRCHRDCLQLMIVRSPEFTRRLG